MANKTKAEQAEQEINAIEADGNPNSITFEFEGAWFTMEAFADRDWEDVFRDLADLSGENGVTRIPGAIKRLVGADAFAQTKGWTFKTFQQFSRELSEKLNEGVGGPGE